MVYIIFTVEILVAIGAVAFVLIAAKDYRAMKREKKEILSRKRAAAMMQQLHEFNDLRFEQGLPRIQLELPKIKAPAFDEDEYELSLTFGQWIRYKEMKRKREREENK